MALASNGCEGGTNGVSVSTANSGGASGNGWDGVTKTTGASDITFTTSNVSHGSMAMKFSPAAGEIAQVEKNVTADPACLLSFNMWMPVWAGTPATFTIAQVRPASGIAANIQVHTGLSDGTKFRLRVQDAAGATQYTSSNITPATNNLRCELRTVKGTSSSNGVIEFAYYVLDNTTAVETSGVMASENTGTTDITRVWLGRCSSASANTTEITIDSVQIATGPQAAALPLVWPATPPADTPGGGIRIWTWDGTDWV